LDTFPLWNSLQFCILYILLTPYVPLININLITISTAGWLFCPPFTTSKASSLDVVKRNRGPGDSDYPRFHFVTSRLLACFDMLGYGYHLTQRTLFTVENFRAIENKGQTLNSYARHQPLYL
jgi:hypothetical protein